MKKYSGFLKFVIITSVVLFGTTIVLLYFSAKRQENDSYIVVDPETMHLAQLDPPQEGDPVASIDTTLGEMKMVLYPQYSPNAVRNFTELAESGYYNDTYIYNVENGVYASAGSKQKNGELQDDCDKTRELIERELHQDLWPFRGAVCSLNTEKESTFSQKLMGGGKFFNGSRFALINSIEFTDEFKEQLLEVSGSQELAEAFIKYGGVPNYSQQMTVIGQIYEGLDVLDEITSVDVNNDGHNKAPAEDILIKSVTIGTYHAENTSAQPSAGEQ